MADDAPPSSAGYARSGISSRGSSTRIVRACLGIRSMKPLTSSVEHHLMHRRRRHAEIHLHIALSGRSAMNLRAVIDERKVAGLCFGRLLHRLLSTHSERRIVPRLYQTVRSGARVSTPSRAVSTSSAWDRVWPEPARRDENRAPLPSRCRFDSAGKASSLRASYASAASSP